MAMPIHVVQTALYQIMIQFDEETIQLMRVTYTTKVFNPYKTSVLFVGHRHIVQAKIRRHRLQCLIRFSTVLLDLNKNEKQPPATLKTKMAWFV